jgi:Uncharacterised nucleotidyltransferase
MLLRAAILDGSDAAPAWRQWQQAIDFDAIDWNSQQLLPLVYHNLTRCGIGGPLLDRCKGYYRLTWYKNHLLFHRMADVLHAFQQAGIRTLLLKGAGMAVHHYRNPALRPMDDFDVLVPADQGAEAYALARQFGFASKFASAAPHGWDLVDSAGRQLDLHRYAFHYSRTAGIDDTFWQSAIPCNLNHAASHVLHPTDQLLHVCARAFYAPGGSIRWIADAIWLLRTSGPEIDWQRLLAEANKRRVTLQLKEALNYLADRFGAYVPAVVRDTLAQGRVSFQEYAAYDSALHGNLSHTRSVRLWVSYCARQAGFSAASSLEYCKYLQERWAAPTLWRTPAWGAFKAVRKLARLFAARQP